MTYDTIPVYSIQVVKNSKLTYPILKIGDKQSAAKVVQAFLENKDCEHLLVLLVDSHNNYLGLQVVAMGNMSNVRTAVRNVFTAAIAGRANAIIIAHNHPSGDATPSADDKTFTAKLVEASQIMGIPILDHVIVSSGMRSETYSFLENGLL